MCFGGNQGSVGTTIGVGMSQLIGRLSGGPAAPPTVTPAAAIVASPALARVSSANAGDITRRPDSGRMTLGSAPATPQQTLRSTLGGL